MRDRDMKIQCAMCDEWYDGNGERAKVHLHPEPQSGPARNAFVESGLPYERWITETSAGKIWADMRENWRLKTEADRHAEELTERENKKYARAMFLKDGE